MAGPDQAGVARRHRPHVAGALVAGLCTAWLVGGCDFEAAYRRFCDEPGRCDAGSVDAGPSYPEVASFTYSVPAQAYADSCVPFTVTALAADGGQTTMSASGEVFVQANPEALRFFATADCSGLDVTASTAAVPFPAGASSVTGSFDTRRSGVPRVGRLQVILQGHIGSWSPVSKTFPFAARAKVRLKATPAVVDPGGCATISVTAGDSIGDPVDFLGGSVTMLGTVTSGSGTLVTGCSNRFDNASVAIDRFGAASFGVLPRAAMTVQLDVDGTDPLVDSASVTVGYDGGAPDGG